MIVAIGHDLIEIERIRRMLQREGRRAEKLFTEAELAYCARLQDPAPSLAARFAAKEAFQKVWPRPHRWQDVWVIREETPTGPFSFARPRLGYAPHIAREMQLLCWAAHLTLTHTKEHASAIVVLEEVVLEERARSEFEP